MSVSRQRKEKMKESLDALSSCEHEQIYKIIRSHTDSVTCSDSGVLVSADVLSDECFEKLEKYIDFCFVQKKRLDADEATRSALYKSVHSTQ